MYIYADESGHTGKYIFNEPPFYFQGAILSTVDTESLLNPIADYFKKKLNVCRLHANELQQPVVEEIALLFLKPLTDINWVFHITVVEKQYLSVTKFVDSIFDSFENKGVRWLWYNHEFFRHTLCCFFDDLLSTKVKRKFWEAYLKDDYQGICSVMKFALNRIDKIDINARLKEVSKDGLTFALENPKEITLMANQTKKSYKGHTPNMVAFISLLQSIHEFCKKNNVVPETFIHDPQSEFGATMREYHNLHSNVRTREHKLGLPQSPERVKYGLGEFALCPAKDVASLQAVDIFLWLSRRTDKIENEELKRILISRTDPFYISRAMSEMIVYKWILQFSTTEFTQEQLIKGKKIIEDLEQSHLKRLDEFKSKRLHSEK
jgi:hypothetical protein